MRLAAAILLPLLFTPAPAAETKARPPTPAPPSEESLQPQVTIIQGKHKMVEEYRLNGRLYMIKVIPDKGPPYYLVDTNGTGQFERRSGGLSPNMLIPAWVLFRW